MCDDQRLRLRDFGSTIQSQFGVSPTVEQTVTTLIVTCTTR
jgi:hypothetical protein